MTEGRGRGGGAWWRAGQQVRDVGQGGVKAGVPGGQEPLGIRQGEGHQGVQRAAGPGGAWGGRGGAGDPQFCRVNPVPLPILQPFLARQISDQQQGKKLLLTFFSKVLTC